MATIIKTRPVAPAKLPKEDFHLYTCWPRERVYQVMNTEAETIRDDVFLAVHTSYPLNLVHRDPNVSGVQEQIAPETFLERFLDQNLPHVQAAILGESGSGKSHLIQWLRLNIPDHPSRIVISIPKAGMGLRGVVTRLISYLPPEIKDSYSDKLRSSGGDHEPVNVRRQRLCSEIALALLTQEVFFDRPSGTSDSTVEQTRAELAELLPSIFRDPALIPLLTRDGGYIAALVEHIDHGAQAYRPSEQPFAFAIGDLPLALPPRIYMALGETARLVCDQLEHTPELRAMALQLINAALQVATRQMLSLASDDLGNLMADIRRHFKRLGKHLVLLIEDFARLQGIDRPLLDALIQSGQGTEMCALRWAMAVTSGYYGIVANTVQTRMNFVVDMNLPRDTEGVRSGIATALTEEDILVFAARYLNVVRVPAAELEAWHGDSPERRTDVPNACGLCPHAAVCHATFGEAGDMGLYPFNRNAILSLARAQDKEFDKRFNPRSLITLVLTHMLDLGPAAAGAHAIEENAFPPEALLQRVGGSRIDAVVQQQWRHADPINGPRQIAFATVWGDQNRLPLDPATYHAFGIPMPRGTAPPGPRQPDPVVPVQPREDPEMAAIGAWMNNRVSLPQALTNSLRGLVFDALVRHIDWDQAGLTQTDFYGREKPFRPEYIIFQNPAVRTRQTNSNALRLNIPLSEDSPEDLTQAGIALEALLHFDRRQDWLAPDAASRLPFLANCLEQWSDALLRQLHAIYRPPESTWDPAASAAELLAIGATLAGRTTASDSSAADLHGVLFAPWPELPAGTASKWRALYTQLHRSRESLVKAIRAVASGTKGGEAGRFLDASRTLPAVAALRRRHWRVDQPLLRSAADLLPSPYLNVAKLHREVFERLPEAAQEALDKRREWLAEVRQVLAPGTTRAALIAELDSVKDAAFQVAIPPSDAVRRNFESALNGFRNVQYEAAVDAAARVIADASLDGTDVPLRVLPALGRTRTSAVEATSALIAAVPPYLNGLDTQLTVKRQQALSLGAGKLLQDKAAIERDLTMVIRLLETVQNHPMETPRPQDAFTHSQSAHAGIISASATAPSAMMTRVVDTGASSAQPNPEPPSLYLLDRARELRLALQGYSSLREEQGDAERFDTRASALSEATKTIAPLARLVPVFASKGIVVDLPTTFASGLVGHATSILDRFVADPETIIEPDPRLKASFWDPLRTLASQRLNPPLLHAWHSYVDAILPPVNAALLAHLKKIPVLIPKIETVENLDATAQALRHVLPKNGGAFSELATAAESLRESLHGLFGSEDGDVSPEVVTFLQSVSSPEGAKIDLLVSEVRDWLHSRGLLVALRLRWQAPTRR